MDDFAYIEDLVRDGSAVPARLLAIARRAVTWLAIADAPRDGTSLLLSDRHGLFVGQWYGGHAFGFWTDGAEADGRFLHRDPYVWMALPSPPSTTGAPDNPAERARE